jgi:DNA-binding transcriptional LysR family regulator
MAVRPSSGYRPAVGAFQQGLSGVEIRHLSAFEAVVAEGSFGRAARRLGYTQSGVSGQIARLEQALGQRLLEREAGGGQALTLTQAGEVLLGYARAVTDRLRAAQADLSVLREGREAALRVGIYQSVGATLLPAILDRLGRTAPGVEIELFEAGADRRLQEQVAEGELDIAFAVPPVRPDALASAEVCHDPFVLVLAEDDGAEIPDLDARPLLAFKPCIAQTAAEEALREWGLSRRGIIRLEDAPTIYTLVAAGECNALLPRLATVGHDLPTRPLPPRIPARTVLLVWHRNRLVPEETRLFVDAACEAASDLTLAHSG